MASTKQTAAIDTHNRISAQKLESILKLQLETLHAHPEKAHKIPPLMIWGSPGCGKSSIIKQVADEAGIDFVDFRLSQVEPVDLRGLPVPNKDEKSVEWFVTAEFPRDPKSKGILLFDEITAADRSLQVAAYELILDRRLGKLYSLPDGWLVVGAGNKVEDHAVSTTMSSALANRFMHVELQANQEDWISWARHNDVHPSVIGFLQYKPALLFDMDDQNLERGWPSPRSWERVSEMCHACSKTEDIDLLRNMVYGLVGNGAGVEFMAFHSLNAQFDNVLDMMTNPKAKIKIPEQADRKFALCSSMVYLLWRGKDKKDQDNRLNGFLRICIELPSDFASMAMLAAMEGNDKKIVGQYSDMIIANPLFKKWREKHQDALLKHMKKFSAYGI